MHKLPVLGREGRMWSAMLASLRTCFGCRMTLINTTQIAEGFCTDCTDRSRRCGEDELGGEA